MADPESSHIERLGRILTGGARSPRDRSVYPKLSLVAFLAWIGLGSDGISSSCYGPPEAFMALGSHIYLGVFVALATALTIFIISASYSQTIELFPSGGGGYLVASKLLSPRAGAVSGCALLVDYVLTIAISIASGTDALFSFLPAHWHSWKLPFAIFVVAVMTLLNVRGVRESVVPLVPIFLAFILTHVFVIVYAVVTQAADFGALTQSATVELRRTSSELGLFGLLFLIMRSYSMGAGTYTGIEAVSNSVPVLREPKVQTAKLTMTFMWVSLSFMAVGLMLCYLLYRVSPDTTGGKTLNALVLERATSGWGKGLGGTFLIVTLISETAILFIAAQTGFLGGPRVLSNMATDRWLPTRLSLLSDRLVVRNGILIMSTAALVTLFLSRGSVGLLIVLYSINVFITFSLSQAGMVRHWWRSRGKVRNWFRRLLVNGIGLGLTTQILIWMTVSKFYEGGWVTLAVTTGLVVVVSLIKRHYASVIRGLKGLEALADPKLYQLAGPKAGGAAPEYNPHGRTAVVLVSGFNGPGLHTTLNVIRVFGDTFKNFVFLSVGVVDAGNFKGADEVAHLEEHTRKEAERYVELMRSHGYYAESLCSVGTDLTDEVAKLASDVQARFANSVFFAGQLIFPKESLLTRLLHNNIVFTIQKRLYRRGVPFVILPIRV